MKNYDFEIPQQQDFNTLKKGSDEWVKAVSYWIWFLTSDRDDFKTTFIDTLRKNIIHHPWLHYSPDGQKPLGSLDAYCEFITGYLGADYLAALVSPLDAQLADYIRKVNEADERTAKSIVLNGRSGSDENLTYTPPLNMDELFKDINRLPKDFFMLNLTETLSIVHLLEQLIPYKPWEKMPVKSPREWFEKITWMRPADLLTVIDGLVIHDALAEEVNEICLNSN